MINGMRRIGIYGGTFSPPHRGHAEAAAQFMRQMKLDYLYVIPASLPPHKQGEHIISSYDRIRMCELAFAQIPGVIVSDMEIRRGGVSYTVDTLRELAAPDARLFLLCGTDMILTLDEWHEPREIFRLCYPVYIRRENDPILTAKIVKKIGEYNREYGVMARRVVADPIEISSTQIRRTVSAGGDISGLVCPAVAAYIRERGLYREENGHENDAN